jgi:hypothetical protein
VNRQDRDAPFHLAGWILFLVCAFLFLYVAIRDSDFVLAFTSLVFLAGCVAFLVPLIFPRRQSDEPPPTEERPTARKQEEQ